MGLRDLIGGKSVPDPRVPDGLVVYAVGDIHGCATPLARIHERILADAERSAATRRLVVYLGDYVDRGPDSRAVIEMLATDPLPGFERITLRGNHDAWMAAFLDDAQVGRSWLFNGGGATLDSYGIEPPRSTPELPTAQSRLREVLPPRHRDFLETLRPSHREGDYYFVHAGIRPGVALDLQSADDQMWIRDAFLDSEIDHGAVIVHGHTISEDVEFRPNRIGVDTGAFATGRLSCLVLEGADRRVIEA